MIVGSGINMAAQYDGSGLDRQQILFSHQRLTQSRYTLENRRGLQYALDTMLVNRAWWPSGN